MKVTRTVLESIIRRTLREMSDPQDGAPLATQEQSEEAVYRAAYTLVRVLFEKLRFDLTMSTDFAQAVHGVVKKYMSPNKIVDGKGKIDMSAMLISLIKEARPGSEQEGTGPGPILVKLIKKSRDQLDQIASRFPSLQPGLPVAKASVEKLIKAALNEDIVGESLYALVYRFYPYIDPPGEETDNFSERALMYLSDYPDLTSMMTDTARRVGMIEFTSEDAAFMQKREAMVGIARKVFDEVTKFYRHHDIDDPNYKKHKLSFYTPGPDAPDPNDPYAPNPKFTTGWRTDDVKDQFKPPEVKRKTMLRKKSN
jgi:hypothetical protein